MEKYIGNKSSLLPTLEDFLKNKVPGAKSLSDFFSGTTNVGRYFRARGWSTHSCDTNRFSYVLAHAYLRTTTPPTFSDLGSLRTSRLSIESLEEDLSRTVARYGKLYLPDINASDYFLRYHRFGTVLAKLQQIGENNTRPWIITEYYTQWGARSAYESMRGSKGLRNYFSQSNALVLDGVLYQLRQWWRDDRVTYEELFLLLASVIEEVVITANVNGTFHDFNRERIWPNAQQSFRLRLPVIPQSACIGEIANADAPTIASHFAHHEVCYLDPPYNFRQYGAYYHLLNLIPAVPFLEDVEQYMEGVSHVRGQNLDDNFTSDFCFRDRFISSLRSLIEAANTDHIVLSYYSGRNHWNHWSTVEIPTDAGKKALEEVFRDRSLFEDFEVVPVLDVRLNYQSRVGEQKGLVDEHLFYGKKKRNTVNKNANSGTKTLDSNSRWGLTEHFRHLSGATVNFTDEMVGVLEPAKCIVG
jgi:adenine-specific DNA-methyltransferase